ncbi:helicase protein MOM1-like isoform X1 [Actinidia eriantha]|uniref:helicase protein MOM1-like isoform X1 n=1 Tax=Actinidia eriantha TaxID=165200 RepID=UPI002588FE70|nr:helicase protein MOM1-like isoform X1 [Actinidia eriantha]
MVNDTRSTRRNKDDEITSSTKKAIKSKGSSTSGSPTTDTSGLRRSTRGTPSRKQISSSPSTTRKSERLEKRTPTTIPVKRKHEIFEKQKVSIPLRRSDRGKKHLLPSSSGSRKSEKGPDSSDIERKKLKREKSMKQLTLESREINRRGQQDPKPVGMKKKRMDARTYISFFKQQLRRDTAPDTNEELERPNKLSQVDSNCCGGSLFEQVKDVEDGGEECSEGMGGHLRVECTERASEKILGRSVSGLKNLETEALGNHGEVEVSCTSQKSSSSAEHSNPSDGDGFNDSKSGQRLKATIDDAERVQVDCSSVEKSRTPELVDSACMGRINDGDIDEKIGDRVAAKRKRHSVQMDCNASTTFASKHSCTSNKDAAAPPSFKCIANIVGTCHICSKRRRVDYDSIVQELCVCNVALNKRSRDSPYHKDRGETEANVQGPIEKNDGTAQQESPLNAQIDGFQKLCVICKLGGKLLCCVGKGCKRRYHPSCLDPPLDDVAYGDWHCCFCVKKKIELGVYSVSEGVDSVWDAREVEVRDTRGSQKQKQYFVGYKGLSHVHNHWVPESQLILEAPLLVSKFNGNNQIMKWKEQWRTPHRLLKKRLLRFPEQQDDYHNDYTGDISDCCCEWLVKWCGLDYENSTWELESAAFLKSPQVQSLIRKYENRRQRAKRAASFSQLDKKKGPLVKIPKPPAGVVPLMNSFQLSFINKLREYWHKGRNAVVIGDQDRITKVILFILSLLANVSQPFLVISNSSTLALWEAEFLSLGPSTDVVVYSGNKDSRRIIRAYEFYEEGGSMMFQVLLSPIEALVEDFETLECLRWEAIIIDECQCSGISKHFEQIKMLSTDLRVLLFNGQLKDSILDHVNVLSLLESFSNLDSSNGLETKLNANLGKLKERLSQFIAYECKSNFSRFLEYWVPVPLSNIQLEQYCATLLSNFLPLRSGWKKDLVEVLRDIHISARKSCDHPYIVDPLLQSCLTKDLPAIEYLDVGIKASGKLQFLDTILSEIQNRGLRVVILFQSISGSGRDTIGDILEDFIRQRFGADCYERIDGCVLPSKKQAILNNFNGKGSGKFVFLLENHACHPSVKLSSVDTIVIFDSDWNPTNDLRALQKISIVSSFEQIKIFRLYSAFTVEEKVLVLATQDVILDSNIQSFSRNTLLMWGAAYLFNKLEEFHGCNISTTGANIYSEPSLLKDISKEFLTLLGQNSEKTSTNNSLIIRVQHCGGAYRKNVPMLGELKIQSSDGEEPVVFWTKLLEGRNPHWRYSSGPSQRSRKRVQQFRNLPMTPENEIGEVVKKRKKAVNNSAEAASPISRLKEGELPGDRGGGFAVPADNGSQLLPSSSACISDALQEKHASTSLLPEVPMVESEEGNGLRDVQKHLFFLLKPEISRLCEVLKLSEDVKVMAGKFLEYIIDNHKVIREPTSIFQAFQISLCWIAASMLKYKIDKKESISLAKQQLNFVCTEEEANNVCSMLRLLKKMFLHHAEYFKESERAKDSVSSAEDIVKELHDARKSLPTTFSQQNVKLEVEERLENQESAEEQLLSQLEQAATHNIENKEISKSIEFMQKKCEKRMKKLIRTQQEEIQEFYSIWEKERVQLEKQHRLESALVRSIHSNNLVRSDKLKRLDDEFAKKMDEHNRRKGIRLKDIEVKQLAERNEKRKDAAHLLEELKSWVQAKVSVELPMNGAEFRAITEHRVHNVPENIVFVSGCLVEEHSPNTMQPSELVPSDIPRTAASEAVGCGDAIETPTITLHPNDETDAVSMALHGTSVTGSGPPYNIHSSADASENNVCVNLPSSEEQILDEASSRAQEVPESALYELMGAADSVEIVNPNGESNREVSQSEDLDFPILDTMTNLNDAVGNSMNGASLSVGLSLVETPLVQPVVTPVRADMSSQNLVLQYEHIQSSISVGMHDSDSPARGNQNVLSPSTDSPVDQNQPDSGSSSGVEQPRNEGQIASLNVVTPQRFEPAIPSSQTVLQHGANLGSPPIHVADDPLGLNQLDLHIAVRNDHPPSGDILTSFQNAEASSQVNEEMAWLPNQMVPGTQFGMDPPIDTLGRIGTHLPLHSAHQVASWMPTPPLYADPLQNELERLRKETEQTIQAYEDMKLRLKSDWDKEIEEIIAEIRQKYEAKLKDAESEFFLKKKELDTTHSKVLMNKILAEAFRSKCLYLRPSRPWAMQQVVASNLMQQAQSSQVAPRPSLVTSSAPVVPASTSQDTTVPPLQVAHHPSALFSSSPTRPPFITPITSRTGNSQMGGALRAPAPHLQAFRIPSSLPRAGIASQSRGLPSHQAPRSFPITSPLVPIVPSQYLPPRPPPPPPTYYGQAPQPGVAGGLPSLQNSSLSAMGLLVNVNNQSGATPPNILPPLPDFSSGFGSLDLSQFGAPGVVDSGVSTDVCLSSDNQ